MKHIVIECTKCKKKSIKISSKINDDYSSTFTFEKYTNCGHIFTDKEVDNILHIKRQINNG